ncbi:GNAT family N-acetyltransferase [Candidatus Microgenomates bacterium]|nr:GNAT family N-acetyltransferase [Candidatus Microgenomates bacterium]
MSFEIQASFAGDPTFDRKLQDFHALVSSFDDKTVRQRFHCKPDDLAKMVTDIGYVLGKLGGILAIAYSNGVPVGEANLIAMDQNDREGWFEAVVHQDHRRHGVSSRLKTVVFGMAPKLGVSNILCSLELNNPGAIASTLNYAERNSLLVALVKNADGKVTYCLRLPV